MFMPTEEFLTAAVASIEAGNDAFRPVTSLGELGGRLFSDSTTRAVILARVKVGDLHKSILYVPTAVALRFLVVVESGVERHMVSGSPAPGPAIRNFNNLMT